MYYIICNGQQVGPMPKEQLVNYGLCPTSKVWAEGMPEWVEASTVADLQPLLNSQQNFNGSIPPEVSFGDAIKICFNKYADFEGRARRSEFWWWYLFTVLVGLAVGWIPVVGWIASIALWIPSLAVGARRLHDTGRSGWLQLLMLIPCIGTIIMIIWWCEDSKGDNEYGQSPKYPGRIP